MTEKTTEMNRRQLLGGTAVAAAGLSLTTAACANETNVSLEGKSVLLTGCSSGFGKLAALDMARKGANIIASMRNIEGGKRKEAQELADVAASEKLKLKVVEIDVLSDDLVESGARQAMKITGGKLDALVNNAGIGTAGPGELFDLEAMKLMLDTNLLGYLRMARAVLPAMRKEKEGLVINVSSQLGRILIPNLGMYSASKFGVEAMFETMAYELAPFGVEMTIIEPGGYPTKIWENGVKYSDDMLSRVDEERSAAYAAQIKAARQMQSANYSTDPMDVPKAIAEVIALKPGSRPLRRAVHPNTQATDAVNGVSSKVQSAVLGNGPYAAWHKAVTS